MTIRYFSGWDIGGAHLKLACVQQGGNLIQATQYSTPLWEGVNILNQALSNGFCAFKKAKTVHGITLTAELADVFADRISGVTTIIRHISDYFPLAATLLYAGRSGWVSLEAVPEHALDIASANWHATASFVARRIKAGVLVDIGSTTTDIVMFNKSKVRYHGYTDHERLMSNELVYTGVVRTPVMAVTSEAPLAGRWQPLTAESFATMADVYRLTGDLSAEDDMQNTPDGQAKTMRDSARRLARMFGSDLGDASSLTQWRNAACAIASIQLHKIGRALQTLISTSSPAVQFTMVGAGVGSFLARKLAAANDMNYREFTGLLKMPVHLCKPAAVAAAAVSVAQLARIHHENPAG